MSLFGKLFPETLFPRKLSTATEQRLRLAQARAEDNLINTHVANALLFVETLSAEVGYERAIDIYVRELGIPDPLSSVIATRALVTLGEQLMPTTFPQNDNGTAETVPLPKLHLDDADRRRKA